MKHFIITLLLTLSFGNIYSQSLPNYDAIKLESKSDFNDEANNAALKASTYLLSTPMEKSNIDRLKSMQYVINWMTGSPDYSFTLDEQATKFAKNSDDLLGLYMAAMTKYVLENKSESKDQAKIKIGAIKHIIKYAKDANNNLKINKELRKLIQADDNGNLAEYLHQ